MVTIMDEQEVRDSILLSIKKKIGGLDEDNEYFNTDLILNINASFMVLAQVGVGPAIPYKIDGPENTWDEFECHNLEGVKEYLFIKAKLTFDPPQNGSAMNALEKRADELEWRLQIFSEELNNGE